MTNILHVDADPEARALVRRVVARARTGAEVIAVDTLRGARSVLAGTRIACVVTEVVLPDAPRSQVCESLASACPDVPVVAFTVERMPVGPGASGGWITKDATADGRLLVVLRDALGQAVLAEAATITSVEAGSELRRFGGFDMVVGGVMQRTLALVECAAESEVPVLIEGETGTGKEILARALHARSRRSNGPFVVQNCGALSETLLESELFGHVRGAFTGADRDRRGLFLEANGGTVFLDEIGEAPLGVQAKLLRVLQHGEVKPVGADRVEPFAGRVVAATNRPLRREIAAGRFRPDLYYRLAVFPITVPPLRQRPGDVERMATHFLERLVSAERKPGLRLSRAALAMLRRYAWPGNVRELEHEVHRIVLTHAAGSTIEPAHLSPAIRAGVVPCDDTPLADLLACVELALIRQRLARCASKTDAARSLGISREALYLKLRRLGALGGPVAEADAIAESSG